MKDNQKQIIKYTLIGITAVLLDLVVYYVLSYFYPLWIGTAKAIGFIVGSIYTFYFNKFWTWRQKSRANVSQWSKFLLIYTASMFINIAVNHLALELIPPYDIFVKLIRPNQSEWFSFFAQLNKLVAFFFATLASAVWNFMGQKYWVFSASARNSGR